MKKDEAIEEALLFDEKIRADNPMERRVVNFRLNLSHRGYSIVPNEKPISVEDKA